MAITIAQIAELLGGSVDGDGSAEITGLAKIEEATSGQLSFIANPKYTKFIETTHATAILVDLDFPQSDKTLIRIQNPYFAFLKMAEHFYVQEPQVNIGIHHTAVIGKDSEIGEKCAVGAHVVIGKKCKIGRDTVIYPGVVIGDAVEVGEKSIIYANVSIREKCRIGNKVIIHPGAVIGSDGFGFAFENGVYHKLPQMGNVVIEDDVEIGANTTIDRATLGETRIKQGAKIDNLVQIAHNVQVGENTVIAAQTGLSGSAKVGKNVKIGGQAGFVGHIEIGDNALIGAQSGVTKSVPDNAFISGYPARPHMKAKREEASLAKLPDLLKKIRLLESKLEKVFDKLKID